MLDAALALEQEPDRRAFHVDVAVTQRRQSEGLVLLGVLLVADARERRLEKADDRGHDLLLRQAGPAQVACDASANAREHAPEPRHAAELVGVTSLPPPRVVAVLLAAPRVPSRRLKVTARSRRDPHVLPRRRDDEGADPFERRGVTHQLPVRVAIFERPSPAHTPDPGTSARRAVAIASGSR